MKIKNDDEIILIIQGIIIVIMLIVGFLSIRDLITQNNKWREWKAHNDLIGCRKLFGEEYNLIYVDLIPGTYRNAYCVLKDNRYSLPDFY